MNIGHGRIERRELWFVDGNEMTPYLEREWDWPGVRLCGLIRRCRKGLVDEQWQIEEHTWISSLDAEQVDANGIATALRGHWVVENNVFYVRDVTYGEDRLHARKIGGVLATIRNTAINITRLLGHRYIPDGRRSISASADYGLSILLEL